MAEPSKENLSSDEKIIRALKRLKEILSKENFNELKETVKMAREYPEFSRYLKYRLDEKIKEFKKYEATIKKKEQTIIDQINELKSKKQKTDKDINDKYKELNKEKSDIIKQFAIISHLSQTIIDKQNELDNYESILKNTAKVLKQEKLRLDELDKKLSSEKEKLIKERNNIIDKRKWDKLQQKYLEARTREINEAINNKEKWVKDLLSTLDQEIPPGPLPEGKKINPSNTNLSSFNTVLPTNVTNIFGSNLNDKIGIRLLKGETISRPYPAYYESIDDEDGIIYVQILYYWKGTIEIYLKEDIKSGRSILYTKGQILGKLSEKLFKYTIDTPIPLSLFLGILEGKDEVSGYKINAIDENYIYWSDDLYRVPLNWYRKLKEIISEHGLEGLIKKGWITGDLAVFITNRHKLKNNKKPKTQNNASLLLVKRLNETINNKWEGRASELLKLIGTCTDFPSARHLGMLLSQAVEENNIPGWKVENIRIGETRKQGYRLTPI